MAHSSSVVLLAPSRPRPFATFRRCTGVAPARPARTIHRAPRDSHILPSPLSRRPPHRSPSLSHATTNVPDSPLPPPTGHGGILPSEGRHRRGPGPRLPFQPDNSHPGDPVVEKAVGLLSREHCTARLEKVWGPGDGRPVKELKDSMDQLLKVGVCCFLSPRRHSSSLTVLFFLVSRFSPPFRRANPLRSVFFLPPHPSPTDSATTTTKQTTQKKKKGVPPVPRARRGGVVRARAQGPPLPPRAGEAGRAHRHGGGRRPSQRVRRFLVLPAPLVVVVRRRERRIVLPRRHGGAVRLPREQFLRFRVPGRQGRRQACRAM